MTTLISTMFPATGLPGTSQIALPATVAPIPTIVAAHPTGGIPAAAPALPPPATSIPRRRHRRISRFSIPGQGVGNKPTIKRLARRGGVKRMAGLMNEETRGYMIPYVQRLLADVVLHTTHDYRTTVTAKDVVRALRRNGRILYGFDA
ncbi:hypothetical protein K438DRAFT_1850675 [Mycena galopus ATCC 62051]|nr:hypothetical protein K438DRAFT_1850675 [Mycena galopus ATCC 62051]